jgi:AbrB family looped-hinge helix DNA binding protein
MQVTISSRGRIVIPIEIRKKYGIMAGTHIVFTDEGEHIWLQPITREYVHSLRGKYRGKGLLIALMADRKREREL